MLNGRFIRAAAIKNNLPVWKVAALAAAAARVPPKQ
jgi:hypothetical protein